MKQVLNRCYAEAGFQFVLTEAGDQKTPESARGKREVGKPIRHFEKVVPALWVTEGWVQEAPAEETETKYRRRSNK